MRREWFTPAILLTVSFLAYSQSMPPAKGHIVGTVTNEDGQLVPNAHVCTSYRTGNNTGISCLAPTDQDGRFQVDHLEFGIYRVFAITEDAGYSIENQQPGEIVRITQASPAAVVVIRLKPKGAVLMGSVRDKSTGLPVKRFVVNCENIENNGGASGIQQDGQFRMVVPINSDLVIAITADGYKGWVYTDPANPARPVIRMASGETRQLEIEMEPKSPAKQ